MAYAVRLRTLDGDVIELGVADEHFVDAGSVAIDQTIDATRWYAMPGLADCHAHLNASEVGKRDEGDALFSQMWQNAWAQIERGVFLVADKGTHDEVTLAILDEPPTRRPDLFMAGQVLTAPSGYYQGLAREVDPLELPNAVAELCARSQRSTWVKLIGDWPRRGVGAVPNFDESAMAAAVDVAHRGGKRVAIHACAPRTSSMAVAAGIDSIEHGLFLTADDLTALGRRGGAWVATIFAMEKVRDMLGATSSGGRLFAEGLTNMRELLPGAREQGVVVLSGSDLGLAHGEISQEALRLADYGLASDVVVDVLTDAAYRYFGQPHAFEVGATADVLCVASDPRTDLATLSTPTLVIRHGRILVHAA